MFLGLKLSDTEIVYNLKGWFRACSHDPGTTHYPRATHSTLPWHMV